jgi:hypothetical protein
MHVERDSWIPSLAMEEKMRNAIETWADIALYMTIIYMYNEIDYKYVLFLLHSVDCVLDSGNCMYRSF